MLRLGWQAVREVARGRRGEPVLVEVLFSVVSSWEPAAGDGVTGLLGAEVASQ